MINEISCRKRTFCGSSRDLLETIIRFIMNSVAYCAGGLHSRQRCCVYMDKTKKEYEWYICIDTLDMVASYLVTFILEIKQKACLTHFFVENQGWAYISYITLLETLVP